MIVVINLKDLIIPILFILTIFIYVIYLIVSAIINRLFKHNCYDCKYYKLDNVAGAGDRCWYKCAKLNRVDAHSFNDKINYKKCKYFEEDEK